MILEFEISKHTSRYLSFDMFKYNMEASTIFVGASVHKTFLLQYV